LSCCDGEEAGLFSLTIIEEETLEEWLRRLQGVFGLVVLEDTMSGTRLGRLWGGVIRVVED
jgi:hypothetical protein